MLDPVAKEAVEREDYEDLLEKLARGCITCQPTILSRCYVDFVNRLLLVHGCIVGGRLAMGKLRECLRQGEIDLDVFNKPLWNVIEELDF